MAGEVRIDKWLWAVRLYKTRALASEAVKKNRIVINGKTVKPSRGVKIGDKVSITKPPVVYTYEVLDLSGKRMGAKLVPNFIRDITPTDQLEILELHKLNSQLARPRGLGRPTKRDRRDLEEFSSWDEEEEDSDDETDDFLF